MLAAWLRRHHPHIITGAIAASAPVASFPSVPGFTAAKFWEVGLVVHPKLGQWLLLPPLLRLLLCSPPKCSHQWHTDSGRGLEREELEEMPLSWLCCCVCSSLPALGARLAAKFNMRLCAPTARHTREAHSQICYVPPPPPPTACHT